MCRKLIGRADLHQIQLISYLDFHAPTLLQSVPYYFNSVGDTTVAAEGRERTSNGNSSSFIFNGGWKATSWREAPSVYFL